VARTLSFGEPVWVAAGAQATSPAITPAT